MKVFHGFDALPHFVRPAVTVGSYDGVHSGHKALLRVLVETARQQGGESVVFTFEPHPRITLERSEGLRLLTTLEEKALLLKKAGVDNLVVIPFDKTFSLLTPDRFIGEYLVGKAGAQTLVIGFNHHFGRDQQGSHDYLATHAPGLRVVEVAECDVEARKVSSTVVRRLIGRGEMAQAATLLGHPYLVIAEVSHGRAHHSDPLKLLPPQGNYDVHIDAKPGRITIGPKQEIIIHNDDANGRTVLTF